MLEQAAREFAGLERLVDVAVNRTECESGVEQEVGGRVRAPARVVAVLAVLVVLVVADSDAAVDFAGLDELPATRQKQRCPQQQQDHRVTTFMRHAANPRLDMAGLARRLRAVPRPRLPAEIRFDHRQAGREPITDEGGADDCTEGYVLPPPVGCEPESWSPPRESLGDDRAGGTA